MNASLKCHLSAAGAIRFVKVIREYNEQQQENKIKNLNNNNNITDNNNNITDNKIKSVLKSNNNFNIKKNNNKKIKFDYVEEVIISYTYTYTYIY